MSAKPKTRNWNDVQTAIATAAIVTTLGMWNLFAAPDKTVSVQAQDRSLPPTEPPAAPEPGSLPHVKIMFTQIAPQTTNIVQQPQQKNKTKKNNHANGGGGGGAVSVTQTKSS